MSSIALEQIIRDAVREYGVKVRDDVDDKYFHHDQKKNISWFLPCFCCCQPVILDDDSSKVAAIAIVAAGFFFGLYQTIKSLAYAIKYQTRLNSHQFVHIPTNEVDSGVSRSSSQYPKMHQNPYYVPEPSLYPSSTEVFQASPYISNPIDINPSAPSLDQFSRSSASFSSEKAPTLRINVQPLNDDALVVLRQMRNDRLCKAFSQGLMTAGIGLITVIVAVALFAEFEIYMIYLFGGGLGLLGVGGSAFILNSTLRPSDQFHEALRNLNNQVSTA